MQRIIKLVSLSVILLFMASLLTTITANKESDYVKLQNMGISAFKTAKYPEAAAYFNTAVQKVQKYEMNDTRYKFLLHNYSNLAMAIKRLNYHEDAIKIYKELVKFAPNSSPVWYFNMAQAYHDKGKFYNDYKAFSEANKTLFALNKIKSKIKKSNIFPDFNSYKFYLYGDIGENYMMYADYKAKAKKNYNPKSYFNKALKYTKKAISALKKRKRNKTEDEFLARMYYNGGLLYYRLYLGDAKKNDKDYLSRLTKDVKSLKDANLKKAISYFKKSIKYKPQFIESHNAIKQLSPLAMKELKKEKISIKRAANKKYKLLKLNNSNTKTGSKPAEVKTDTNYNESAEIQTIKFAMLEQLNKDRARHKLKPVKIDNLCAKVGDIHCKEEQKYTFIGHQLTDGYNPYYHYSQLGGNDYHAQNAAARWGYNYSSISVAKVIDWVLDSQYRMYSEVPPNDGHRVCMLDPNRTHVGIGLAYSGKDCFVTQEFVNRYAKIENMPRKASLSNNITLKGKSLTKQYKICGATLFYEPFAKRLTPEEINNIWHYGLPKDRLNLYPKITGNYKYPDGSKGDIVINGDGSFEYPFKFYKSKRGVYTAVTWFIDKTNYKSKSFPVTSISIRVE